MIFVDRISFVILTFVNLEKISIITMIYKLLWSEFSGFSCLYSVGPLISHAIFSGGLFDRYLAVVFIFMVLKGWF